MPVSMQRLFFPYHIVWTWKCSELQKQRKNERKEFMGATQQKNELFPKKTELQTII